MNQKKIGQTLGLFREGFRQCQMMGILLTVVMNVAAILVPLYIWVQAQERYDWGSVEIYSAWLGNFLMLLTIPFAFFMTLVLFRFLNSRAASDLYHAMPHKRISLYLSFSAAILAWMLILIVSSTLVSTIACTIVSQITLLYDTILPYTLSVLSISVLLMAGTLVGMSLSGTLFTNVLLSAIVMFFPRLCVTFLQNIVTGNLPFMVNNSYGLSGGRNLLFSLATVPFSGGSGSDVFDPSVKSIIYTFVLALIYFVIGMVLFCRRKSEVAGQSAPSRLFQHIYRILVTMIYCVFVTGALASDLESNGMAVSGSWFEYMVLYLVALLIYFVYELITTKKWRNLLSALPGLGVVVVLNGALLLGMHLSYQQIVSLRPAASEIESVSIEGTAYEMDISSGYVNYASYVGLASREIELTDPTIVSLVSYSLQENLETWDEDPEQYYAKYYGSELYNSGKGKETYTGMRVMIRTKNKEFERRIYVSSENMKQMMEQLREETAYTDIWRNPPTPVDGSLMLYDFGNGDWLTEDDMQEIYDSYCAELKTVPFDTLYDYMTAGYGGDVTLAYTFHEFGETLEINCPISAEITPDTLQLYYDKLNAYQQESGLTDRALELLTQADAPFTLSATAYLHRANGTAQTTMDAYLDTTLEADVPAIQAIASYLRDADMTLGTDYIDLWISPYVQEGTEDWESDSFYLLLPVDAAIEKDETLLQHNDVYFYENEDTSVAQTY